MRILLHIHEIDFVDLARSRFQEANSVHGAASDFHHLIHRVRRILQGFRTDIESVHLSIPGNTVGKINIQACNIPQGISEFTTIEAPGAACPERPLFLYDPFQKSGLI